MKKYYVISYFVITVSFIIFTTINGGIYLENTDLLVTNILVLHIEIGFVNLILAYVIKWFIKNWNKKGLARF